MAEFKFTSQVVEVSFVAAADPTMRVVTELVTAPVSGGGGGSGDVVGPSSATDGRPAGFDGTTGKKLKQLAVNSPNGLLVLNEDGVVPEARIGTNIVRESEMASAISDAVDAIPAPAWDDVTGKPTSFTPSTHTHGKADITDFAHTHTATSLTTTELSTAKVLQPDGAGGVAWGVVAGGGQTFPRHPTLASGSWIHPETSSDKENSYHALSGGSGIVGALSYCTYTILNLGASRTIDAIGVTVGTAATAAIEGEIAVAGWDMASLLFVAGRYDAQAAGHHTVTFAPQTVPQYIVLFHKLVGVASGTNPSFRKIIYPVLKLTGTSAVERVGDSSPFIAGLTASGGVPASPASAIWTKGNNSTSAQLWMSVRLA